MTLDVKFIKFFRCKIEKSFVPEREIRQEKLHVEKSADFFNSTCVSSLRTFPNTKMFTSAVSVEKL